MNESTRQAVGALFLRLSLGVVFIAHSVYLKLMVYTLQGAAQFFDLLGLPGFLAYVVFAAEAVGSIALVLGLWTRWVALALIPIAVGATWAHLGNGWLFTNPGGGWEYPLFLTLALVVQSLIGDGALALGRVTMPGRLSTQAA